MFCLYAVNNHHMTIKIQLELLFKLTWKQERQPKISNQLITTNAKLLGKYFFSWKYHLLMVCMTHTRNSKMAAPIQPSYILKYLIDFNTSN